MSVTTRVSLGLSDDGRTAAVRLSSRSAPIVCGVLGEDRTPEGFRRVYLDGRIHSAAHEKGKFEGWAMSGAVSTIMTRVPRA